MANNSKDNTGSSGGVNTEESKEDDLLATPSRPTQQKNGDITGREGLDNYSAISASSSITSDGDNPKVSPSAIKNRETFVINSDSSFDPDNNSTIDISSSSSSSSSEEEFDMYESVGECVTPSPFRKGRDSKSQVQSTTHLNPNPPAIRRRSKRHQTDPPPGAAGGGPLK